MSTEVVEVDELQGRDMGGPEDDGAGDTGFECFGPSGGADTPLISGSEAFEPELGYGGDQVVAATDTEIEEFDSDPAAHDMEPRVVAPILTATGAVVPREGFIGAGLKFSAEDIASLHPESG